MYENTLDNLEKKIRSDKMLKSGTIYLREHGKKMIIGFLRKEKGSFFIPIYSENVPILSENPKEKERLENKVINMLKGWWICLGLKPHEGCVEKGHYDLSKVDLPIERLEKRI